MKYLLWCESKQEYKEVSVEELEKFRNVNEYYGSSFEISVVVFEEYRDGAMYFKLKEFEC